MKIGGIIAEYNPFHNGHGYHLRKAREATGADCLVCVMSGHFTQRGEPAIFDKWIRTEAALASGADIVVELPLLGALQSAEGFASCGVRILNGIGADAIAFGSETPDIALLEKAASLFAREPEAYRQKLTQNLSEGHSFPAARLRAAASFLDLTESEYALLSSPNAILAVEYLKAMIKTGSNMRAAPIERQGSGYNERRLAGVFPSATALRAETRAGGFTAALAPYMPQGAFDICQKHLLNGFAPVFLEDMERLILYVLRKNGVEYIRSLCDVAEGLEYRIARAAEECAGIAEMLAHIKTKRYTYTRLCRVLLYALLGVTKDAVAAFSQSVPYARVLGIRLGMEPALSHICQKSAVPVVVSPAPAQQELLAFDMLASDIYALTQKEKPYRTAKRDLTHSFIRLSVPAF